MASTEDRNRSLKQALVESLSAILSPDQQSRQTAEEQLKVLEVTEGKNVCFCLYFSAKQFVVFINLQIIKKETEALRSVGLFMKKIFFCGKRMLLLFLSETPGVLLPD